MRYLSIIVLIFAIFKGAVETGARIGLVLGLYWSCTGPVLINVL